MTISNSGCAIAHARFSCFRPFRPASALSLVAFLALAGPAGAAGPTGTAACAASTVYIGTMSNGPGQGVYMARLDAETGQLSEPELATEAVRPMWVLADPARSLLYVVNELATTGAPDSGSVSSFTADPATGHLTITNTQSSAGKGPTALELDRASQTMFVANFGSGHVATLPVQPDGTLAAPSSVQQDFGSGPSPRQTGPHPHEVVLDPSRRFLLVPDLGADRVFLYRFDAETRKLSPGNPAFESLPPGSGPRHLVFDPQGRFVFLVSELSSEVRSYRWQPDGGRLTLQQTLSTLPQNYKGTPNSVAAINISRDGSKLYLSNRGEDMIAVYTIDRDSGLLQEAQRIPAGGSKPWSLAIDPSGRWMVVTNQNSSTLTVLKVDPGTGLLAPTAWEPLPVPKPVSIAFLNRQPASSAKTPAQASPCR